MVGQSFTASFVHHTITVLRASVTHSLSGGQKRGTPTPVTSSINIPAAVQPHESHVIDAHGQRQIYRDFYIYIDRLIDIQKGDTVQITAGPAFNSPVANPVGVVLGIHNEAGSARLWKIIAREQT